MTLRNTRGNETFKSSGNFGLRCAFVALATLVAALGGCNRDEVVRAFRAGSSDYLQAGAESIALGVINGAFSAFDVGADDSGDANTSGAGENTTTTTP
jgi:hypothetical protein